MAISKQTFLLSRLQCISLTCRLYLNICQRTRIWLLAQFQQLVNCITFTLRSICYHKFHIILIKIIIFKLIRRYTKQCPRSQSISRPNVTIVMVIWKFINSQGHGHISLLCLTWSLKDTSFSQPGWGRKIHSSHSEKGHSTLSLLVNKLASEVHVNYIICCTDPRKISIVLRKKSHHHIQRRGLDILKFKWELTQKFFSISSTAAKFLTVNFLDLIKLRIHLQEKQGHTHKNKNCVCA